MAGSQKEFELLFKLKASLGGGFNNTFKSAIDTNKKLQESIKSVNSIQSKVDGYTKASTAIDKQKEKLAQLQTQHEKTAQKVEEHKRRIETLKDAIEETGDETGALRAELNREEAELEKCTDKLKSNKSQIRQTTAKIEEQTQGLDKLGQELRDAGVDTDNLESSNERLKKSYEKLKTSQDQLNKINEKQAQIKQNISATKTQLLGTVGTIAAVSAAVYAGPVKAAQKYETAMKKVATIADTQEVPLQEMSSQIMKLSNTTGIAATAIAEDVYNAISAGQKTSDAVNFVSNSTKLAKAGFAESAQTLDVLTTILNAYGMEADKVGSVSDMLIQIQNKGKVTVGELSSVMGKIIPTANANGVALEQLGAGYAIMTSKGIAAAETTTYMNSMLNELGKSGTTADKLLRSSTGKSFKELTASGKSLGDVLGLMQDEATRSGKSLSDMFGSAEAGKAAVSLLSGGVDGFNSSVQGMIDSAGATEAAFAQMENTTEAKMAKAKNSISNLGIVLGQTLLPIVGDLADKVAVVITKVAEFAQANPKLVSTVMKVAAGLAALKVGMLGAKMVTLSAESGILSLAKKLLGLKIGFAESAATGVKFTTRMANAGKGLASYFSGVKGALGGVGAAVGNIFRSSPILSRVTGLVSGITEKLTAGFAGLAGKLGGVLTGTGTKMLGFMLKPFSALGGRIGGLLSGIGGIIARSPIGTIGKVIASGFGKIGTLIAPIGNLLKSTFAPLAKLGTTLLGPLGGIAGKLLPVVGVVTAIITAFQLVKKHIEKIRDFIQRTFGDEALAVFDKIVAVITNIGETIKGVFSDGNIGAARDKIQEIFGDKGIAVFDKFAAVFQKIITAAGQFVGFVQQHIVPVVETILSVIVTSIIPGIMNAIQAAAPVIMSIIQSIADFIAGVIPIIGGFISGLMPVISGIVEFIQANVFPVIQEIFSFITGTVLPMISAGIQAILPIVQNILATLLPAIQTAVTTIWNIVQPIIQGILAAVQFVMPTIQSIIQTVISTITGIIKGLMTVLSGVITFITGVFSGNWSQAWEGIKTTFSGIWEGMKAICTGVINGIISAVNVVIRGLNKLKVPDWVPGIGGKGVNISEIPMLAKGSKNTPETFIAGEKGPELITNAPGRTVYTADQTKAILGSQNAAAESMAAAKNVPATNVTNNNTSQNAPQTVNNYNVQEGTVYTADQMKAILGSQNAAAESMAAAKNVPATNVTNNNTSQNGPQTVNNYNAPKVTEAPEVVKTAGRSGSSNITITNSPTIIVNGEKPEDLEEKLEANNRHLLQQVENMLDKKNDDERRSRYE